MRMSITIDDELMKAAQQATSLKTKRAVIEEGLRRLVRSKRQVDAVRALKGAVDWYGDLSQLRGRQDGTQQ